MSGVTRKCISGGGGVKLIVECGAGQLSKGRAVVVVEALPLP